MKAALRHRSQPDMDDLSEAGLDLELRELGKRLDSLLISRGWNMKTRRDQRARFAFSVRQHAAGTVHVKLDAVVSDKAAREVADLVARHGFIEAPHPKNPAKRS